MSVNPRRDPTIGEPPSGNAAILIVDDEPSNVGLLARILARAGYHDVRTATDPVEGLRLFTERQPDIVLLDMHMPQMDGIALMQRVQSTLAPNDFVPVVILTGDLSNDVRQRALALGAIDFITKPFEGHEVLLRIRNLLQTRMLHRALRAQNEELEVRVRERTSDLELARLDMLERLARASDFRDDQTGEHTRRVGRLAERIALELGLGLDAAGTIGRAAMLHDIGKIGIPDGILLKPSGLTQEEFSIIRRHTHIGRDILSGSPAPLLQVAATIAFTHHERWDGRGYEGMIGEQTPLEGRIVTVADTFDVLTNGRPYRSPSSLDEALDEMRSERGRQFDPTVLDAFLVTIITQQT
ncbi:MAG TPA: HD domain-containing phosphohydrolase [Longimicrobiales bacterium]|nr:HD domain-containing phosphohydrolase [Longimicrobiales bacterium]